MSDEACDMLEKLAKLVLEIPDRELRASLMDLSATAIGALESLPRLRKEAAVAQGLGEPDTVWDRDVRAFAEMFLKRGSSSNAIVAYATYSADQAEDARRKRRAEPDRYFNRCSNDSSFGRCKLAADHEGKHEYR